MIDREHEDGPWLVCDHCEGRFWAVGLDGARDIRGAAKDLDGWYRRRFWRALDPDARPVMLDLCAGCGDEKTWDGIRMVDAILTAGRAGRPVPRCFGSRVESDHRWVGEGDYGGGRRALCGDCGAHIEDIEDPSEIEQEKLSAV